MSKYTLELRMIVRNINIFEGCNFYTDNEIIRKEFENKFIDTYYFHEIGFETVERFKHRLKTKLNNIMPYYKQLYQTELEAKDINFLLNKDLTETFEREAKGNNITSNDLTTNDNTINDNLESNIEQGNASLELTKGSLTNVSKNTNNSNATAISNSKDDIFHNEKTVLKSQGNIGITSSAELLDKWRKVLINIDEQIINDCSDLFMQVY